jgi:phosphoglycerate dehydrogenase-like enzyme
VTITPGANQGAVAEHTVAMMLGVAHGFPARDKEARSGTWTKKPLPRLSGKTLGLVGLGQIGKAVVPLAAALGMSVIAHDPLPDLDFAGRHGVELVSFDELLGRADVVSLHLPCTPQTTDLINARTLAEMKPGAILINTSRGGLVDEDALLEALRSGHLRGAALDVFKVEPLPPGDPLAKLDNALLCPHIAGADEESLAMMSGLAAETILQLHQGRWPEGRVVNDQLRQGWKW